MTTTLRQQPFSLVLSGGGALGIAHLGVLHDLEKEQLHPAEIIGTSMGGIIGACLATGMKEEEIYGLIREFATLSSWISFSFSGNAIVDNDKIAKIFSHIFRERKMQDTAILLKLITTDLVNGHKRVFSANDDIYIKDAVLATMAIPGVFESHRIGENVYGDGFLCENLGINETAHPTVLAVDVLGENSFEKEMPDNFFKTANVLEMFEKSIRLLIYNQTRTHIQNSDRQIFLLEPDTRVFKTYHFHQYEKIRLAGSGLLK
jgi:NTE family protein